MRTGRAAARRLLAWSCLVVAATLWAAAAASAATVEVKLVQTPEGKAYFEPAGVHIAVGDTVRWIQVSGFHSVTAYHPDNGNHELRIPESAQPWDSDMLLAAYPQRGAVFEHVFTVAGVYDYFCKPHEMAGMVGRVVVGDPGDGPGTKPFAYAPARHWNVIPAAARAAFPAVDEIVRKGKVRAN